MTSAPGITSPVSTGFRRTARTLRTRLIFDLAVRAISCCNSQVDSQAIYANVGYNVSEGFRVSGRPALHAGRQDGAYEPRHPASERPVRLDETNSRDWSETSWDISAQLQVERPDDALRDDSERLPVRPVSGASLLPARCRSSADSIHLPRPNYASSPTTMSRRLNYEVGLKGEPFDNLQLSIAVFSTDYSDLPYQVSTTTGRRVQHREHHRRPDLARRRMGKHLAGDRRLPPAHDSRLH